MSSVAQLEAEIQNRPKNLEMIFKKTGFIYFLNTLLPMYISTELIKNSHGQLLWGGITLQMSIYHSFPLKPGCIWEIELYLISNFLKKS